MESLENIKVSIIIPVYNVESYVEDCLHSVMNQSYNNIECIFVDDCTADSSTDIIKESLAKYKGPIDFRIISHSENMGLSAARNTGIRNSKGYYLFFLDSDDEITENAISNLVELCDCGKVDCVVGGVKVIGDSRQINSEIRLLSINKQLLSSTQEIIRSYYYNEWYVMAWNKLIRRDFVIINDLMFQEGLLHEDQCWSYNLSLCAKTMAFCFDDTYVYKIRSNSITSRIVAKNLLSLLEIVDINYSNFQEHPNYKYALPKLRSTISFTIKNICMSDEPRVAKYKYLHQLKSTIRRMHIFSLPVDFKDAVRQLLFLLNEKMLLLIYKK